MSKSNVIIKGISLYDIDIDGDVSDDEPNTPSTKNQPTELRFINEVEQKFKPNEEIRFQVFSPENSGEILTDVKTEKEIELITGEIEDIAKDLADFKSEVENESGIIHQTWLNSDKNEDSEENFENLEEIQSNYEVMSKQGSTANKKTQNFARKSTAKVAKSSNSLSMNESLRKLQQKAKKMGISIKTSPKSNISEKNSNKRFRNLTENSSEPQTMKVKEEISETNGDVSIKIMNINSEPPKKVIKLSPGSILPSKTIKISNLSKFQIIKAPSNLKLNNLNESKFIKIPLNSQSEREQQEIKQEPELNFLPDGSEESHDKESSQPSSSSTSMKPISKSHQNLRDMFQRTLQNQGESFKKVQKWMRLAKANPELLNIDLKSPTTSQASQLQAPRTITISKVSTTKHPIYNRVESFKCKECNIIFFSRELFDRHMSGKHTGDQSQALINRFRCIKCQASYPSMEGLKMHVLSHERAFKCNKCEKSFSHNYRLQDHLALHENDGAFACKICGRKFTRSDVLNQHIKIIHTGVQKMYKCTVCTYKTHVKQNYEKHQNMHWRYAAKLRGNRFFYCDECPQSFREENALKDHKNFVHR